MIRRDGPNHLVLLLNGPNHLGLLLNGPHHLGLLLNGPHHLGLSGVVRRYRTLRGWSACRSSTTGGRRSPAHRCAACSSTLSAPRSGPARSRSRDTTCRYSCLMATIDGHNQLGLLFKCALFAFLKGPDRPRIGIMSHRCSTLRAGSKSQTAKWARSPSRCRSRPDS